MKRLFLSLFFVLLLVPAFALLTIKGKIVDSDSSSPIDFVNVALINEKTQQPAAGVTTDAGGTFELPTVTKGKYTLRISFVGYNTLNIPLNVSDKPLNLGTLKLQEDSKALAEVVVVGQGSQMTFDIDKKVFSVDQNVAAAGGSASDVLQNIPSVDVDGEGNVSLRNNSSVEVWINGKPSGLTADNRAQVLQQMPAESIDKIEVMTNPSAKYKPEGTSGIINIVLKKNRKAGYYGSVSAGLIHVDKAKPKGNLGLNLNYSSSKLDAFVNLGYRAMDFVGGGTIDRFNLNSAGQTVSSLLQTSDMGRGFSGFFGRAGVDFHINDKHTLSLSGFGMWGSGYSSSEVNYQQFKYTNGVSDAIPFRTFSRMGAGVGTRPSTSVTVDYKFDIDKNGSNLTSSLTYSPHGRTGSDTIKQIENGNVTDWFYQDYEGNSDELEFKLDYTKIFKNSHKLELGLNAVGETRESPAFAYDLIDNKEIKSYYNNFVQSESNFAGYATYGSKIGKFTYQAGLRAEYFLRDWDNTYYESDLAAMPTTIPGEMYKKWNFFPSAFVSYSLPNKNELQLNVTRRIRRPHGREINPFRNYSDSTNISYGNPDLLPELSNAFEFNYIKTWDNHTLSSSVYYRFTDNVMQSVQFLNKGTMENTTMNVAKSTNLGLELVAKNRILKVVNLTSTLNLYYNKVNESSYASIYDPTLITFVPEKELFSWNVKSMANIILGKNTFLQLSGDYSAPRLIAQGEESASYAFDLGLRQTFMNKNLSLNVMVRDMFNTRKRTTITYGDGFKQDSQSYFMGRMIGITATYNFGNMKPKQTKKPSTEMNMDGGMD